MTARRDARAAPDGAAGERTPATGGPMVGEAATDAAVKVVQALARKYGGGKGGEVDAFIAERRAEAAKERDDQPR